MKPVERAEQGNLFQDNSLSSGISGPLHDFDKDLNDSHKTRVLVEWEALYRKAFPDFQAMHEHSGFGDHQRAGIDRSITLTSGKQYLVEEKIRFAPYNDILLEYECGSRPGWVCKQLLADYVAYMVPLRGRAYLLPVAQMQSAWLRNADLWIKDYALPPVWSHRNGRKWATLNAAVPADTLFRAIGQCFRHEFTPFKLQRANNNGDF